MKGTVLSLQRGNSRSRRVVALGGWSLVSDAKLALFNRFLALFALGTAAFGRFNNVGMFHHDEKRRICSACLLIIVLLVLLLH